MTALPQLAQACTRRTLSVLPVPGPGGVCASILGVTLSEEFPAQEGCSRAAALLLSAHRTLPDASDAAGFYCDDSPTACQREAAITAVRSLSGFVVGKIDIRRQGSGAGD